MIKIKALIRPLFILKRALCEDFSPILCNTGPLQAVHGADKDKDKGPCVKIFLRSYVIQGPFKQYMGQKKDKDKGPCVKIFLRSYVIQGPYKQYMGRSKLTGNITVVLYEDPPDGVPKIHIRFWSY